MNVTIEKVKEFYEIQEKVCKTCCLNEYSIGILNGIEIALSILEERKANLKELEALK
jgi:hypothetical protein